MGLGLRGGLQTCTPLIGFWLGNWLKGVVGLGRFGVDEMCCLDFGGGIDV